MSDKKLHTGSTGHIFGHVGKSRAVGLKVKDRAAAVRIDREQIHQAVPLSGAIRGSPEDPRTIAASRNALLVIGKLFPARSVISNRRQVARTGGMPAEFPYCQRETPATFGSHDASAPRMFDRKTLSEEFKRWNSSRRTALARVEHRVQYPPLRFVQARKGRTAATQSGRHRGGPAGRVGSPSEEAGFGGITAKAFRRASNAWTRSDRARFSFARSVSVFLRASRDSSAWIAALGSSQ